MQSAESRDYGHGHDHGGAHDHSRRAGVRHHSQEAVRNGQGKGLEGRHQAWPVWRDCSGEGGTGDDRSGQNASRLPQVRTHLPFQTGLCQEGGGKGCGLWSLFMGDRPQVSFRGNILSRSFPWVLNAKNFFSFLNEHLKTKGLE